MPQGRVYFEVEGSGPPIILVPGGPGSGHAHYHPWFTRLAGSHSVLYFDQLGTGRSDRLEDPHDYSVGLYAETIACLLRELQAARAHIIGVSFGGIAAADFAARYPDRTSTMVLANAQVDAEGWQSSNIDNVNAQIRMQFPETWTRLCGLRAAGVPSSDTRYQELMAPALDALEWASLDPVRLQSPADYRFDQDTYQAFLGADPEQTVGGALHGHTVLDRLRGLEISTMVVTGRHDRVTVPAIAARVISELNLPPQSLHVFERSAHRPWAEEPEGFFRALATFLDRSDLGDDEA